MTVAELIAMLQLMPQDIPVVSTGRDQDMLSTVSTLTVTHQTGRWWDCETQLFATGQHVKITGA